MILKPDAELQKLQIHMIKTDEINKNANAIIDKGCRELEDEIKRLEPDGNPLTQATLKLAVLNLNSKLRRKATISAFELNTSRDQNTGENLQLNDKMIRSNQLLSRKQIVNVSESVHVGDTVRVRNKTDKHKANDAYIVTNKSQQQVELQKIMRPLSRKSAKLANKIYKTHEKYLLVTHRPGLIEESDDNELEEQPPIKIETSTPKWTPINHHFYEDTSDDEDVVEPTRTENSRIVRFQHVENEMHWDHSPEQYALLDIPNDDINIDDMLRPIPTFQNLDDSMSGSSHEEVFMVNSPTLPTTPKLRRRNAIRYKNRTEPRITRSSLSRSIQTGSQSQPTTPARVNMDRCQNLEDQLRIIKPLAPEAVDLQQVQDLTYALPDVP